MSKDIERANEYRSSRLHSDHLPARHADSSGPSPRHVTPLQLLAVASGALTAGALLGGVGHYYSTAKGLAEEGLDPRIRLRSLPLAVSAHGSRWGATMHQLAYSAGFSAMMLAPIANWHPPIPLQAKALALGSAACAAAGALGVVAWKLLGLKYKEVAEVSSISDAVSLAKAQRKWVAAEFRRARAAGMQEAAPAGSAAAGSGEAAGAAGGSSSEPGGS